MYNSPDIEMNGRGKGTCVPVCLLLREATFSHGAISLHSSRAIRSSHYGKDQLGVSLEEMMLGWSIFFCPSGQNHLYIYSQNSFTKTAPAHT